MMVNECDGEWSGMDKVVKVGGMSNGDCGMALNGKSPIASLLML